MKKNKISIVVPIYKVPEKFLRRCIESLMNQTLKNIEIVLVDDESPDNCGKICDEYHAKDSRIRVLHQKNKGLSGARNSGVNASNGDWITFVDGDDFIELDMCEKLYNAIEDDIDIICCGVIKDYGSKLVKYNYENLYENNKKYLTHEDLNYMRDMLLNFNGNNAWAYAKLIKKELIVTNHVYHDEKLRQGAEGLEFNVRLFKVSKGIKFIKEYEYHYVYNDNSITTTHNEKNHEYVIKCFEQIEKNIDMKNEKTVSWFYNRLLYVIVTTAISGYFNPTNKENYKTKKSKYKSYLNNDMLKNALKRIYNIDIKRKIILYLIKFNMFKPVELIAKVQYEKKCKMSGK